MSKLKKDIKKQSKMHHKVVLLVFPWYIVDDSGNKIRNLTQIEIEDLCMSNPWVKAKYDFNIMTDAMFANI